MSVSTLAVDSAATLSFGPLPVDASIARALETMGYAVPTPIQEQAIPPMRAGRDVLGQAQTGTGKTAGFGIPLVEMIDASNRAAQAIVLVPTRELCLQVSADLTALSAHSGIHVLSVYGGVGFGKQLAGLSRGAQVIVGTPGRVEDLLQRRVLRLDQVRLAILDEADRMLDVGFLPAIERILRQTPSQRQTALFSATIAAEVRGLAHRQMRDPVTIEVSPEGKTLDEIEQRFERVNESDKLNALRMHLTDPSCFLALVFRRTTYKADRLTRDLSRMGFKVAALHGRRSQNQRERVLADLKSCKLQVLVATDIAARGLDITGLTHVFNYDLPDTAETYVHRIGRTGRAGETGTATTFVTPDDEEGLRAIERYLSGQKFGPMKRPASSRGNRAPSRNSNPGGGNGSRHTGARPDAVRRSDNAAAPRPSSHRRRPHYPAKSA